MRRKPQGYYKTVSTVGENVQAFIPAPLPPSPQIRWSPKLRETFDRAHIALGRLDSVAELLPDTALFLYMYVRKEAVLSSMIEGTQSSLSDLLLYEIHETPGIPLDDVREVSNYVSALSHGLTMLKNGFPISLRLMKEIHAVLLSKGRGSMAMPGEFRRSQNWIGGTRPGNAVFVPPPVEHLMECLGTLELFLHDQPQSTPALLKVALSHVQFETIHPFLDGNGRLGRLLITLLLCEQGILREPLLYLSLYFKTHRNYYYDMLNKVRIEGDWEVWLEFFAEAVIVTASQAVETAQRLRSLADNDKVTIENLGRAAPSTLLVHRFLMEHPVASSGWLVEKTGLAAATVNKALNHLSQRGIVRELTARQRNRVFSYSAYFEILNEGTELPDFGG